jgi:hypothetical protein
MGRINYARPALQATNTGRCLHHITIARVQIAADAMRQAGLTPCTPDLSRLVACTCR